jgi:hypothetical protein
VTGNAGPPSRYEGADFGHFKRGGRSPQDKYMKGGTAVVQSYRGVLSHAWRGPHAPLDL